MDEKRSVDVEAIARALDARKRDAIEKINAGRNMAKRAMEIERQGTAELSDIEAFERVWRALPENEGALTSEVVLSVDGQFARARAGNVVTRGVFYGGGPTVDLTSAQVMHHRIATRSQRDQVVRACMEMLLESAPQTTEELLDGLVKRGVQLTAENKPQRVSQILSTHPQFKNQRGRGWTLDASPVSGSQPDSQERERLETPVADQM